MEDIVVTRPMYSTNVHNQDCFWLPRVHLYLVCLTHIKKDYTLSIGRSYPGAAGLIMMFHWSRDEKQLQEVLSFMEEKAELTEVNDPLHAISKVGFAISTTYSPLIDSCHIIWLGVDSDGDYSSWELELEVCR